MPDVAIAKRARGRPRGLRQMSQNATVQSLDRAIMLLRALANPSRATLSELALRVGVPPSSAHRLLLTLQKHGLVDFNETTQFWSIGVESFSIGSAFVRRDNLLEFSRDTMRELVEETGETANLAIVDDDEVVFISQFDTPNPIRAYFRSGTRALMHCSGVGKAILAEYDRKKVEKILGRKGLPNFTENTLKTPDALFSDLKAIRRRGYSVDDEERYMGMRCVAAPIFDAHGEPVAGISISGPTMRLNGQVIAESGAKVRRASEEITRKIGGKKVRIDR